MNRRNSWLSGAACASAVAALIAAPAQAAAPQLTTRTAATPTPVDCPTALPTAEAVDGLTGTGYTVERGTAPEPFTARVLGRITDGIAPGVDLIMAELDSPAVRRAGGIWAGISGSPVYAADGRLIGSVSYSLAGSSPIAGITPAAALGTLLTGDPDGLAARGPRRAALVRPGDSAARRLARTGEASLAEATRGFHQLQVPMQVSGATSPRAKTFLSRLQAKSGVPVMAGGSSAPTTPAPSTAALAGGDNFAVTVSYGDATLGGVGTATYTCHGRAVAFGHPFTGLGVTTMAGHGARAVYVQPDPVFGAFKVANIGPVVGTVDRDRTLGLRARLGTAPVTATISSTLTRVEGGASRAGTTRVVEPAYLPDAAAIHALLNVDRVLGSALSVGTARMGLTVKGRRANGTAFTVVLGDTFTDTDHTGPIDYQVGDWVYDAVSQLTTQQFEKVTLTAINLTGSISSKASTTRIAKVRVLAGKTWVSPRAGVAAVAGKPVKGQVQLVRVPGTARSTVPTSITPPVALRGKSVWYSVETGYGVSNQVLVPQPRTFDGLLAELRATPRGDEVRVSLVRDDGRVLLRNRYRAAQTIGDFAGDWAMSVR